MTINRRLRDERPVEITISREVCNDCGLCREICPLIRSIGFESLEDPLARYACLKCGQCTAICPSGAISVLSLGPAVPSGKLPPAAETLELIKARRSVRAFKKQEIDAGDLAKLIEAVKYSPTGHNTCHNALMIIQSKEILEKISRICVDMLKKTAFFIDKPVFRSVFKRAMGKRSYDTISKLLLFTDLQDQMAEKGEDPVLFNAPALMLFLASRSEIMSHTEADLAAQTVALLSPTLNIGTCYAGLVMLAFSGPGSGGIRKIVEIPEGYDVFNALVLGYPRHRFDKIPDHKDVPVFTL